MINFTVLHLFVSLACFIFLYLDYQKKNYVNQLPAKSILFGFMTHQPLLGF